MNTTDILVDQRVRAVRVGATSCALIAGVTLLASLSPGGQLLATGGTRPLAGAIAAIGAVAAVTPWRRLFPGWIGELAMGGLLAAVTLTIAASLATATAHPDVFWLYLLTVTFAAMVYRRRGQLLFLGLTAGLHVGATLATGDPLIGEALFRLGALVVASYMAGHLSRISRRALDDQLRHNRELARQSELRRQLAITTLAMTDTDRTTVLRAISEGAAAMGFDAVSISVRDRDHIEVAAAVGALERFVGGRFPVASGIAGRVLESGRTVVIADYAEEPDAHPAFRDLGVRSVVGVPLGDLGSGLLVAVRDRVDVPTRAEVEMLEVLAAQARAALAVAGAYGETSSSLSELRRLEVMKADFLSSVSHELRTPLTVILGLSTTLSERWPQFEEDARRDLVERIHSQSAGLTGVVTSLLDFARLERGSLEADVAPLDLGELVGQVALRTGPLLERHRLSFDIEDDTRVVADRALIERVVENFLTNAARHTPPGTHVKIHVASRPSTVEVSVTDDGPGMPEAEAQRLGERFFRGTRARRQASRGMGLGMALACDILALHDAELEVESAPGRGTSFRFALTRVEREPSTDLAVTALLEGSAQR